MVPKATYHEWLVFMAIGGDFSTASQCFSHNITHVWHRFSPRRVIWNCTWVLGGAVSATGSDVLSQCGQKQMEVGLAGWKGWRESRSGPGVNRWENQEPVSVVCATKSCYTEQTVKNRFSSAEKGKCVTLFKLLKFRTGVFNRGSGTHRGSSELLQGVLQIFVW